MKALKSSSELSFQNVLHVLREMLGGDRIYRIEPVNSGISNQTYFVETQDDRYVLQQLNSIFDAAVVFDASQVTKYLTRKGWLVPCYEIFQGEGHSLFRYNSLYRMYKYIPGTTIVDTTLVAESTAEEAGTLLRKMHDDLKSFSFTPRFKIDHFHDTLFYMQKLSSLLVDRLDGEALTCAKDVLRVFKALPTLPHNAQQLIHGDARIENFLCDAEQKPFSIIDFDTIMVSSPLVDVGDFLRSLSVTDGQTRAVVNDAVISSALRGYYSTQEDVSTMNNEFYRTGYVALVTISLELCARFLIDVEEDFYFGWDANKYPNRKSHNVARAKGQWGIVTSVMDSNKILL